MKGGGGVGGDEAQSPARVNVSAALQPGGSHTHLMLSAEKYSLKKHAFLCWSRLVYAGFGAGLPIKNLSNFICVHTVYMYYIANLNCMIFCCKM